MSKNPGRSHRLWQAHVVAHQSSVTTGWSVRLAGEKAPRHPVTAISKTYIAFRILKNSAFHNILNRLSEILSLSREYSDTKRTNFAKRGGTDAVPHRSCAEYYAGLPRQAARGLFAWPVLQHALLFWLGRVSVGAACLAVRAFAENNVAKKKKNFFDAQINKPVGWSLQNLFPVLKIPAFDI